MLLAPPVVLPEGHKLGAQGGDEAASLQLKGPRQAQRPRRRPHVRPAGLRVKRRKGGSCSQPLWWPAKVESRGFSGTAAHTAACLAAEHAGRCTLVPAASLPHCRPHLDVLGGEESVDLRQHSKRRLQLLRQRRQRQAGCRGVQLGGGQQELLAGQP
jgi:hypothetical protein